MHLRPAIAGPLVLFFALASSACSDDGATASPSAPDSGIDAPSDSDAADASNDADASDASSDADADLGACDPDGTPLDPVGTDDVTYASHTIYRCLDDKRDLCRASPLRKTLEGLLRCDAVAGGYYWEQGSLAFRVVGRAGGKCVVEVFHEVEGGGAIDRCELPLPVRAWPGLSSAAVGESIDGPLEGIESSCTRVDTCSLPSGSPDECHALDPLPPLCDEFMGGASDP